MNMILPLEQQVCSLESAKRLKDLGFTQKSLFYYGENPVETWVRYYENKPSKATELMTGNQYYSAYTVAELLALLPNSVRNPETRNVDYLWFTKNCYDDYIVEFHTLYAAPIRTGTYKSCAEGMAKMLIYLAENKLLNHNQGALK